MARTRQATTVTGMVGSSVPQGWYPDPSGQPTSERYFDGQSWTAQTRTVQEAFPASPAGAALTNGFPMGAGALNLPPDPIVEPRPAASDPASFPTGVASAQPSASPFKVTNNQPVVTEPKVDPNSAQALLKGIPIKLPRRRPIRAEAGWYPDPARTSNLRFYDGSGWTARVRHADSERRNRLPVATVALQAKITAAADNQAVRSKAGERFRQHTLRIEDEQKLPLMHRAMRTRAGRVGGMISVAAVIAGMGWTSMLGWEHWLSGEYQDRVQADMRQDLQGDIPMDTYDLSDPAPVDVGTSKVADKPPVKSTEKVDPWAARPDITPFPPAGWVAPENRRERIVNEFKAGAPVGRIVVPRLGVDRVMVAGTNKSQLAKGVGVGTWGALPGSPGNATLAGHRVGNGELFRDMDKLRYGDQIIIEVPGQGKAVFEVRAYTIVKPTDTNTMNKTDGVRLTLTTCHPPGSTGKRYIVQAELISGDWADKALPRSQWRINS